MRVKQVGFFISVVGVCLFSTVGFGGTYGGGSGTEEFPYLISDANHMQEMGGNTGDWDKHFRLMNDIDLSQFTGTQYNVIGNWDNPFTGTFNGGGNTINNMSYTSTEGSGYVSLFGRIHNSTIKNLAIENVSLSSVSGGVGGLVGYNGGTLISCYATGSVSGDSFIGGLVGVNAGSLTDCYSTCSVSGIWSNTGGLVGDNSGTLTACYATGSVNGRDYVGGLVGWNDGGSISACYSTCSAIGSYYVGGLVGDNYSGSITSCYATGQIEGINYVGGLVGYNYASITACYSIGSVSGSLFYFGGLTGRNFGTTLACFWDIQTSNISGSTGGKGLTTEKMKTLSIYQNAGWANKEWIINENLDYPRLDWENTGGIAIPPAMIPFVGSGTVESPYLISTEQDFALLSWYPDVLDKHIKLTANLDLNGFTIYPIGDLGQFTGVFDGNGHTISNVVISQSESDFVGLFGLIEFHSKIKNLGLENVNIQGRLFVGGLVGWNDFGTLTNCYTTGMVTGTSLVGGVAGNNDGGGLSNCYAIGTVISSSDEAGGLVGQNRGSLTNCYAAVLVEGIYPIGGLVGSSQMGWITACFWDTQISSLSDGVGSWNPDPSGVMGLNTAEMMILSKYTSKGWDFLGESTNGENDIWRMCIDEVDYPRLSWEFAQNGDFACGDGTDIFDLQALAEHWLLTEATNPTIFSYACDANGDGVIDMADYSVLGENW